ncbi:hypothetical protein Ab1vBOLIVR4_gp16c [Agrobacterium phage OLIVR4]|nr:hypothetical protein Ab1vBOLIVR4_gp16c [Agrobacterium phage OLIVR4]
MYAEGYELLSNILQDAFEQASTGKGKERHGRGLPWHEQAIFTLGRQYGPGGTGFQAAKKIGEAMGMIERGDYEAAEREILGTIVYAAATVALVREKAKRPVITNEKVDIEPKNAPPPSLVEPIPEGYEWESHTQRFYDTFQNAYVSIVGEFHSKWIERRGEFPIRRRFIK